MSNSKTFYGITQAVFNCVQATSTKQHGTVYTPPNSNTGTSKTKGTGWEVDMDFNFNPATGALAYKITHATWIVPTDKVWDGISDTIDACQQSCFVKP